MSAKNWMPIYWGDYLRDTSHLSAAQHGAYLLLIGHYWQTGGPLQDNDEFLRRAARMERAEWRKNKAIIAAFFEQENGQWRHARIDLEISAWSAKREKSADRASRAAATRWANRPELDRDARSNAPSNAPSIQQALPEDMLEECPPPPPSPVLPSGKTNSVAAATGDRRPPDLFGRLPAAMPLDLKAQVWAVGVAYLIGPGGLTEPKARSLIGKWRRDFPDVEIINALAAAQAEAASEPVSFIEACLARSGKNGKSSEAGPRYSPDRIGRVSERIASKTRNGLDGDPG